MRPRTGLAAFALALATPAAAADDVAAFYKGRTIDFIVGAAAGGGFDLTARPLAQFLSKYLPGNPNVVVRNQPGAAGIIMTNYIARGAPADGTAIGMSTSSIPFEPRLRITDPDGRNVNYDSQKLQWIGSPVREPQVSWVSKQSGVASWEDMKTRRVRFGATSPSGDNAIFPAIANRMLGLKSEIITGYQGVADIFVAIERGELEANNTAYSNLTISKADWLRDGRAKVLMQFGLTRLPALKDAPSIVDLVTNEEDRKALRFILLKFEMSRPIFTAPGVAPERLAALRAAFDKAVADPAFIAETAKFGLDVNPVAGPAAARIVDEIMTTPQPVVDHLRAILSSLNLK